MLMFHKKLLSYSSGQEISWDGSQSNLSVLSAADKKRKAGRKRSRPGDFDYILEEDKTEETTKIEQQIQ